MKTLPIDNRDRQIRAVDLAMREAEASLSLTVKLVLHLDFDTGSDPGNLCNAESIGLESFLDAEGVSAPWGLGSVSMCDPSKWRPESQNKRDMPTHPRRER
jgi:hypothetical protein